MVEFISVDFKEIIIVGISIPIKCTEEIKRIKDLYRKKKQIPQLLMFLLSINTGIDLVKLLNLKIRDVKNKQYIRIDANKVMPLNQEVLDLISQVTKGRESDDYLFLNAKGEKFHRASAFQSFREICEELCFNGYSTISWRKTFAYHYYKKYKDLSYLMWLFNQHSASIALKFIDEEENMNLRYKEGVCL